jgi:hypothetical protein
MLRCLADENFNGDIVRGLSLREPALTILRAQDVELSGVDDPVVLQWAAENNCIVLTHDRVTMPDFANGRVAEGKDMPGVFVLHNRLPVGDAIEEILLINVCSDQEEWKGVVAYLPL